LGFGLVALLQRNVFWVVGFHVWDCARHGELACWLLLFVVLFLLLLLLLFVMIAGQRVVVGEKVD
jgi:hypothetical protein